MTLSPWAGAGALLLVFTGAAAAQDLQPHRAVYELTLAESDAAASLVTAEGRLVFEMSGAACEGYTVNSRFVTRITDREGVTRTTDIRASSFETLEPASFTFLNQTYVDGDLQTEVKGEAEGRAAGVTVTLTAPKEGSLPLPRAIFPSAHTRLLLEAARGGERVVEASVFDGGDNADTLYDTTTVVGAPEPDLPGATPAERAALATLPEAVRDTARRLTITYFAATGDAGERVPDYEIAYGMLDNGVSYDVVFNYGTFALRGRLSQLELTDAPDC